MELQDLKNLENLNELDLLYKLIEVADSNKKDVEKVLKGEKAPGIRVRDSLQAIRMLCEMIRDKIQIRKGADWGKKRTTALDKAIFQAMQREKKDKVLIEKRKMERLARLRR